MADSDAQAARPDAVLWHESAKRGSSSAERVRHTQRMVGPVLGGTNYTALGPGFGGRVHSSDVGGGWYLSTLDPDDSLLFPTTHEFARQPRYRWVDQPDGTRHGWLLTPREMESQAAAETPVATQRRRAELDAWEKRRAENHAKLLRWRELMRKGDEATPAERDELKQLDVDLFGDQQTEF